MPPHRPHEILSSPDGRLRVAFLAEPRGTGGWSHSPRVIDRKSGLVLIDLWHSEWDGDLEWLADGKVKLDLHRHGLAERCALVLDPKTRTFELFDYGGELTALSLAPPAIPPECG